MILSTTGLKDINGVTIMKGDTVLVDGFAGVVLFFNGGWRYDIGRNLLHCDSSYLFGDGAMKEVKIIKRGKVI